MNVRWTHTAQEHLASIHAYIAQDSPEYAKHMVDRLTRRSQQIARFPLSGRCVPEYNTEQIREVIEGPYRLIYYIRPDQIDVLTIVHAAMNMLALEEEPITPE